MPLILPTSTSVALLLHERTVDAGGNYLNVFGTTTSPTATEAASLISKAYDYVIGKTGQPEEWDVPEEALDEVQGEAKHLIELYSAMLIETSFYSEQIRAGRSPYEKYEEQFNSGLLSLIESLGAGGASAIDDDSAPGYSGAANYGFPCSSVGDGVLP